MNLKFQDKVPKAMDEKTNNFYDISNKIRNNENIGTNSNDKENILRKSSDFYYLPKISNNSSKNNNFKDYSENKLNKKNSKKGLLYSYNKNDNENVNITHNSNNTFFKNHNRCLSKNEIQNKNLYDESYYYKFKNLSKKNIITSDFHNHSEDNSKEEKNSLHISQKNFDFKTIIDKEKNEEEKRINNLLNNFVSNFNDNSVNNHKYYSHNNLNHLTTSNVHNNEKVTETLQKIVSTKSSNQTFFLKDSKNNNDNNSNINHIARSSSLLSVKNDFDCIKTKMINSAENVLNSLGTIKKRNKLSIRNMKLKISHEIPKYDYIITNIKPPKLFEFNHKIKDEVLCKKEFEMQKTKNTNLNKKNFFEVEEENENIIEKEEEKEKIINETNGKELLVDIKSTEKKVNNKNYENKRIILNFLEKDNKKKENINNQKIEISDRNNEFEIQENEIKNESEESSDLDSSFENHTNQNIKNKYQNKLHSEKKISNEDNKNSKYLNYEEKTMTDEYSQFFNQNNSPKNFFKRKKSAISYSDLESIEESVKSLEENEIHQLDKSGILQDKGHESLYIKAKRKIDKNKISKTDVGSITIRSPSKSPLKSPIRIRGRDNRDSLFPLIQLNSMIPDEEIDLGNTPNLYMEQSAKNTYNNSINVKPFSSTNIVDNEKQSQINENTYSENQEEIEFIDVDVNDVDFEAHEIEPNKKTRNEIKKIKSDLNKIKNKRFDFNNEFLNDVHKKLQKKAFEINPDYQTTKDIALKYRQEKILQKTDFRVSSRLYMLNRNPIFQINNLITFPNMINDPVLLASIYNVNMYKIESSTKKIIN